MKESAQQLLIDKNELLLIVTYPDGRFQFMSENTSPKKVKVKTVKVSEKPNHSRGETQQVGTNHSINNEKLPPNYLSLIHI